MAIKNYTTKIGVTKTVAQIQEMLIKKGARQILNEYDENCKIISVKFQLIINGRPVFFKLPARVDGVYEVIYGGRGTNFVKWREQAERVAWRIIKDWIDAQLAIVEAGAAEIVEVFLPYVITSTGESLYQRVINDDTKLLA